MIFKGTTNLSPTIDIAIDGVPVEYMSIKRLTLEMKENKHNLAILEIAGLPPDLIDQYIERPLLVNMRMIDRDPISFHGYISHLEPFSISNDGLVNESPFQMTRVYCLGTSFKMKSKVSRVWENRTLAEIATEIAEKYLFSVSVPNDLYRFKRLVQSNQSDWSFLVQTAHMLGYSVLMDGTNIHIWDPYKSLSHKVSYSSLYTIRGTYGDPSPQPGQIIKFEATIGNDTTEGSRAPDTIHVLDYAGNIVSVSNENSTDESGLGTPLESQFSHNLTLNADSYEMGQKLVSGSLRKHFPLKAEVSVVGDTSLIPGGIVNINKYNARFDGFWYITSVRHEISQSSLNSLVTIIKDSFDSPTRAPMVSSVYKTPPTPALKAGRWISSTEMIDVYV